MACTNDYTGTSIDQRCQHKHQHQHQDLSQSQYSLQSKFLNTYLRSQSQFQSTQWSSPAHGHDYGSRGVSAQPISPTSDVIGEMATPSNEGYEVPSPTKELGSSQSHGYNLNGQGYGHGSGERSNPSTSTTSMSSQIDFGGNGNVDNIYPINNSFPSPPSSLNGNPYLIPHLKFQNLPGPGYQNNDDTAAICQAAQSMYNTYDFVDYNNMNTVTNGIANSIIEIDTDQSLPTSAPPQALFQSTGPKPTNIPVDQAQAPAYGSPTPSPSPLLEVAEAEGKVDRTSSLELTENKPGRRASESTPFNLRTPTTSKRRNQSLSINTGASASASERRLSTSYFDPEEKALRAAAAEGLDKGEKRRMQNKLAQRAFRARNKIVNKDAAGRLEHLEDLTEQQAGRIGILTDLVGRLRKENYALKLAKSSKD